MVDISVLITALESRLGSNITEESKESLQDIHMKPPNTLFPIRSRDGTEKAFSQEELMNIYFKSIQQNFEKHRGTSYELFDFLKYETDIAIKEHIASEIIQANDVDTKSVSFVIEKSPDNVPESSSFSYDWQIVHDNGETLAEGTKSFDFNSVLFLLLGKVFNR